VSEELPYSFYDLTGDVMTADELKARHFEREFLFSASRSSGPGGQNVNKVSSRIELRINIPGSQLFSEEEKEVILISLRSRINNDGEFILVSQSERSQLMNKALVEERFYTLISKVLTPARIRRATRPTSSSVQKRLDHKSVTGRKKKLRKMNDDYETD
jgi:ribosome-associated protein